MCPTPPAGRQTKSERLSVRFCSAATARPIRRVARPRGGRVPVICVSIRSRRSSRCCVRCSAGRERPADGAADAAGASAAEPPWGSQRRRRARRSAGPTPSTAGRQAHAERAVVEAEAFETERSRVGRRVADHDPSQRGRWVTELIAVHDGLPSGGLAATTSWAGRSDSRDSRLSSKCPFESCRLCVRTRSGDRPVASGRCALRGVVQRAGAVQHPRHEQRGDTGGLPARRTGCLRLPDAPTFAARALSAEGACGCVDAAADRCR